MKKIYFLIVFALGSLTLASCGDDDYTEVVNSIQVVKAETTINAAGGSTTITLTGEGLTATPAADWLTASVSGNVLTATATPNPTRESRASHIDVKAANGDTYRVSIVQTGALLALESNAVEVTDLDATYNVGITKSVGSVTVKSLTDWVKASLETETNAIKLEVESNDYDVARVGKVLVTSGTLEDTLFVNQAAMNFVLSSNTATFLTKSASTKTFTVQHSKPVTVESKADWITASITDNSVKLTVTESTANRRSGQVILKSGKSEKIVHVSQLEFADQFQGTYDFIYYDDKNGGWYYFPTELSDKSFTLKPFTTGEQFVVPLTVNTSDKTVKTANCGTYLGDWTNTSGTTYYIYLAWGSGTKWSTATVTNAAATGNIYVEKLTSGAEVTIIDWSGSWVYSGTTYQMDAWLFQAMKAKAFSTANNLGYILKFGKPYLMSKPEEASAKYASKTGCIKQLPNGQIARPAVLKSILRPLN